MRPMHYLRNTFKLEFNCRTTCNYKCYYFFDRELSSRSYKSLKCSSSSDICHLINLVLFVEGNGQDRTIRQVPVSYKFS